MWQKGELKQDRTGENKGILLVLFGENAGCKAFFIRDERREEEGRKRELTSGLIINSLLVLLGSENAIKGEVQSAMSFCCSNSLRLYHINQM
jgi:hypothetical protein